MFTVNPSFTASALDAHSSAGTPVIIIKQQRSSALPRLLAFLLLLSANYVMLVMLANFVVFTNGTCMCGDGNIASYTAGAMDGVNMPRTADNTTQSGLDASISTPTVCDGLNPASVSDLYVIDFTYVSTVKPALKYSLKTLMAMVVLAAAMAALASYVMFANPLTVAEQVSAAQAFFAQAANEFIQGCSTAFTSLMSLDFAALGAQISGLFKSVLAELHNLSLNVRAMLGHNTSSPDGDIVIGDFDYISFLNEEDKLIAMAPLDAPVMSVPTGEITEAPVVALPALEGPVVDDTSVMSIPAGEIATLV